MLEKNTKTKYRHTEKSHLLLKCRELILLELISLLFLSIFDPSALFTS